MSLNNLDHNHNPVLVSAEEEEEDACYLADDIHTAVFFPSANSSEDQAGTLHLPPPIITENVGSGFTNAVSMGDERSVSQFSKVVCVLTKR